MFNLEAIKPVFSKVWEALKQIVLSKQGQLALGFIAVLFLIWFFSGVLGMNLSSRIIIECISLVLIIGFVIGYGYWAKQQGHALAEGMTGNDSELRIEELGARMGEALTALKTSELGVNYRGNAALYALPWFVIIGASASGKSTLLRNSGLHFPFVSHEDVTVQGAGGTRNCDWWFSDQAVILDTAGRYTTEDSDKPEWLSFLKLLKRARSRRPINGIMVAMGLPELLLQDSEQPLAWHAQVIRERIEELYSQLGYLFPISLIITKIDRLAGFNEFFAGMNEEELNQVWGIDLSKAFNVSQQKSQFDKQQNALYEQLLRLRMHRLAMSRKREEKFAIYDFPEQFRTASRVVSEFFELLVKENPYQEQPNFSGVYYTSGSQEGEIIAQVASEESLGSNQFKLSGTAPLESSHRSFFIQNLFKEVVFPNKNSFRMSQRHRLIQRWVKTVSVLASVCMIGGSFTLLSVSMAANSVLLKHGADLSVQVAGELGDSTVNRQAHIEALLKLYKHYDNLVSYQKQVPLHLRLGLYRGNNQADAVLKMIAASMRVQFAPEVGKGLENKLKGYKIQWNTADSIQREKIRGDYYPALSSYLMLSFPIHMDSVQAADYMSQLWSEQLHKNDNVNLDSNQLRPLVSLYLEALGHRAREEGLVHVWEANPNVVTTAQSQLYTPNSARNLYAQLVTSLTPQVAGLTVHDLFSGQDAGMFTSQSVLPGIYTEKAWREVIYPALAKTAQQHSHGDWVIDSPFRKLPDLNPAYQKVDKHLASSLEDSLRRLYFADYASAWFRMLNSVSMHRFSSLTDATQQLNSLKQDESPYAQLFKVIAKNSKVRDIDSLRTVPELAGPFAGLSSVVAIGEKGKPSKGMSEYFNTISAVEGEAEPIDASSDSGRSAGKMTTAILGGANDSALAQSVVNVDRLLKDVHSPVAKKAMAHILLLPMQETWRSILHLAGKDLNRQWQAKIISVYEQTIAGKFPFNRHATMDANVADVQDFLSPNQGLLWTFVNTELASYLKQTANGWEEQKWQGIGIGFAPGYLTELAHASRISHGLFEGDNRTASFSYTIYPETNPDVSEYELDNAGQKYRYYNQPQEWETLHWTANANQTARLTATILDGSKNETANYKGAWGLFHLFNRAEVTEVRPQVYKSAWKFKDTSTNQRYQISVLFRTAKHANALTEILGQQLELPPALFPLFNAESGAV